MDSYPISRRKLLSLSLSAPLAFIASCKKDDNNVSPDTEENRDQMELISEPEGTVYYQGPKPEYTKVNVFNEQLLYPGYSSFRIPVIATTNKGTLLAFVEMRKGGDVGVMTLTCRRSTDNGQTWGHLILAEELTTTDVFGNQNLVIDRKTGIIHLLYLQKFPSGDKKISCKLFHKFSTDDGLTWSNRKQIPDMFSSRWIALGPGAGIQLERGKHAGRLLLVGRYRKGDCSIYSDDGGQNWKLGFTTTYNGTTMENESTCVELVKTSGDESVIYVNSRNQTTLKNSYFRRLDAYSYDSGNSLNGSFRQNKYIKTVKNEGALLRWSAIDKNDEKNRILFSTSSFANVNVTKGADSKRKQIGIWSSLDETDSWTIVPKRIQDIKGGYSVLTKTRDNFIGILFEEGKSNSNFFNEISFVKINEAFLDVPLIGAKWNFAELSAGDKISDGQHIKETFNGGTSRNLTVVGSIAAKEGSKVFKQKTALHFDGTSYLKLDDNDTWTQFDFNENSSFSVELVLKTEKSGSQKFLIGRPFQALWPQWLLTLESDGKISFRIDDNVDFAIAKTKVSISDGDWHHIGAVRDRNTRTIRMYVDGKLSNEVTDNIEGSLANRRPLFVGGLKDEKPANFKGDISFIRITPKALSKFLK